VRVPTAAGETMGFRVVSGALPVFLNAETMGTVSYRPHQKKHVSQ
jgi:hypothetical protein